MTKTATDTTAIDWEACWNLASRLGAHTRALIVQRDYDGARAWALQMVRSQDGALSAERTLTYYELAVLLGHEQASVDVQAQLDWDALVGEVVKLKAATEKKAAAAKADREKAEAEKRAAEEKRRAEREKAGRAKSTAKAADDA